MRPAYFLVIMVWLAGSAFATAQEDAHYRLKEYFTRAFKQRMVVLEEAHRVTFDPGWQPTVIIGFPDDVSADEALGIWAQYDPSTQHFFINDSIDCLVESGALAFRDFGRKERVSPNSKKRSDILELVDHELGHALTDQLSRRWGLGQFPPANYLELPYEERVGIDLVAEGIGSWFEFSSVRGRVSIIVDDAFPSSPHDTKWRLFREQYYFYESALWLVQPALDKNVRQGIRHLLAHRFLYAHGDVRTAAYLYQHDVLKAMNRSTMLRRYQLSVP